MYARLAGIEHARITTAMKLAGFILRDCMLDILLTETLNATVKHYAVVGIFSASD